jgi:ABC-2 type transport system ATP-binding protein
MIETNDLSKYFDDFKAVDGVTLTVKPGQILALLGQNGAGKTTTVRMLTALLNPTRGWAQVNGYDVVKQAADVRASVGVLTEQHGLYVRMTAKEYLNFFGEVYGQNPAARKTRINYLLEYFGLSEVADKRAGEYSKGMRQKLALARALMHEPPVLLLDEPTSAMDPESARLVRDEIGRLKSSQRTIVICTHNLAEAESLADIIAIIYRGRILLSGTLDELKQQILGPVEYEAQLSQPWQIDGLTLPMGVTLSENNGSNGRCTSAA